MQKTMALREMLKYNGNLQALGLPIVLSSLPLPSFLAGQKFCFMIEFEVTILGNFPFN